MKQLRENNLDLLRIICTIAIIALHVGSGYADEYLSTEPEYYFIVGNFYHCLTRFAVPCFVLLSGAFLLNDSRNRDFNYICKKSYRQLWRPLLIISLLYVLYSYAVYAFQGFHQGIAIDWYKPLRQWLTGNPFFHLWYMYMLIGLYLLVPALIRLKAAISRQQYYGVAIICLAAGLIMNNIYQPQFAWGWLSLYYVGYLLWGDIIHSWQLRPTSAVWLLLLGITALGCICYIKQIQVLGDSNFAIAIGNVLDPLNILDAMAAIFIFSAFCSIKIKTDFRYLAKYTYDIYLLHAFFVHFLWSVIKLLGLKGNPVFVIPVLTSIIFVLSFFSASYFLALKTRCAQTVKR